MPRYRVTLTRTTVEIVEAANQFQAAVVANELGGEGAEIVSVVPAVGRPTVSRGSTDGAPAKKRKPLSPEAKARLAQNLVKARAARAAKRKAKQTTAKKARGSKARG